MYLMVIVGYFGGIDPAACLLRDGAIESYVEEERLLRYKHAPNVFSHQVDRLLSEAGRSRTARQSMT
jgi:predicted NodU family carbamoyl transferase